MQGLETKRIEVESSDGYKLYYDIHKDGAVYWLRIRKQGSKLQMYRVKDETLAAEIRELANG